jgi:hypothetical protein
VRSPAAICATGLIASMTLAGCADTPSQQEFDAAMAAFDALPAEAKAYACADDWYAVQLGVEGFVLVERCAAGAGEPATSSSPLSAEFERAEQQYAEQYYAENPPDAGLLSGADPDVLCAQSRAEITAGIEQWREQTQFPTWEGVEFVPSVEHEVAKLLIWQDVACPALSS